MIAPAVIGPDLIKTVLRHRYPMLLIDRIVGHEPGRSIVARRAVSVNEPWYRAVPDSAGPGGYGYPWPMLVESWCHAAGVLGAWQRGGPGVPGDLMMMFGSMTGLRFGRQVLPGEVVEHRVRLVRATSDAQIFEGESMVDDEQVMTLGRIVMAMRPAETLPARAAALTGNMPSRRSG